MYDDTADVMSSSGDHEHNMEEDPSLREKSLNNKTIPQRLAVMSAGSFMNFVLAFVLLSIIAAVNGISTTTLRHVEPNFPAEVSGLAPGDRIVSLNGSRIFLWSDITFEMAIGYGRPIEMGFVRDGQRHIVTVTPESVGNRYVVGISPEQRVGLSSNPPEGFHRVTIGEALFDGFMRIGFVIRTIVITLVRLVTAPNLVIDQIAGPIGIVNMIDGHYQATVEAAVEVQASTAAVVLSLVLTMANFGAVISANLGVMNLLPLPALDGGRIVFLILEAIRRKPISPEREGMVHLAGFVLLMILAVFIAYQDILNLL